VEHRENTAIQGEDVAELAEKGGREFAGLALSNVDSRLVTPINIKNIVPIGLTVFFLAAGAGAQVPSSPQPNGSTPKCGGQVRSTYQLGPDDLLDISGPELGDVANKPVRIDSEGNIQVHLRGVST